MKRYRVGVRALGTRRMEITAASNATTTVPAAGPNNNVVVNVNFKPAYYSKLVAVPAGGGSGAIEVKVSAK